jgi:TetR/AcrR family transcriptional regulator, repressor of fatR-cypB operon
MTNLEFDEVRREKLLRAALGLFVSRGFYGVAVPKIAEAANMATGSVYRYFTNKEELVNILYLRFKEKLKASLVTNYPAEQSTKEQFDFIWNCLYDFADTQPEAFLFIEGHCHASYLDDRCLSIEEELYEIGRSFIRSGQDLGAIRKGPPQLLVSIFFGSFTQYFKDAQAGRLEWNRANSELLKQVCWASLQSGL